MAGDASGSGGADRQHHGETERPDNPWQRIESEKPQRDAARKAWDAEHDPAPEFERSIRPLPDDYGKDRPRSRDLTDEQRAELAELFGRPADELLALRDKDPRAGHNRDEQGRILDHEGNPRPEKTPEQLIREAERQAHRYGPDAEASDLQAPSDQASETTDDQTTEVEPVRRSVSPELHQRIGELAAELRAGHLTPTEAADRIDQLRRAPDHSPEPEATPESETKGTVPYDEPSTETVDTKDGLSYERPERRELADVLENTRENRLSSIMRTSAQRGDDLLESVDEFYGNIVDSLRPASVQPSPSWETPQYASFQGESDQSAGAAVVVTLLLAATAQGIKHRWDNRSRPPSEEDR